MHTLADIVGAGATVGLGALGARASWIQFIVSGAGTIRIGDATTDATHGLPIPAGGGQMLPWRGPLTWYAMDQINLYVPVGATVSVSYAT